MNAKAGFSFFPAILVLLLSTSGIHPSYGQESTDDSLGEFRGGYRLIFEDVQLGISAGDIRLLSRHFAPHVAINLRGDETGTFSSNQTYYVLENFLKSRKFARFKFSTIDESDAAVYGSGEAEFMQHGNREIAQIYVAVSLQGRKYVITQLTIY